MAKAKRRSVEETWQFLEAEGDEVPTDPQTGMPYVPPGMPNYDDERRLGFSFFRTGLEDEDYSNLTIARTYFGRSEFVRVSFHNTDLSESRMCWNDFIECDFSEADMSGADMRASKFVRCKFVGTNLQGADMRRSGYDDCDFTNADVTGVVADDQGYTDELIDCLSEEQCDTLAWTDDEGPEPPGG